MAQTELENDVPHAETRLEHVLHDVEHILHEAENHFSHAAPMGIFCVITLLGMIVLVYRLVNG